MAKKEAVRVFLDSNVILSGLISDKGAPRIILDVLCLNLPFLTGLTGKYNIIEIKRNLTRKIPAAIPLWEEYFHKLNIEIIPIPSEPEINKLLGQIHDKDIPVIVSAINGSADYLVTGDKKDFSKLRSKGKYPFHIISPSEFIDEVLPGIIHNFRDR